MTSTFAKDFKNELHRMMDVFCDELISIWTEIGVNSVCQMDRKGEAINVFKTYIDGMINEEQMTMKQLKEKIIEARQTIKEIRAALKLTPFKEAPNLPLMQLCSILDSEANKLLELKGERMEKLKTFLGRAETLCRELGDTLPRVISHTDIPSEDDLQMLNDEVERLKLIKIERLSESKCLLDEIKQLFTLVEEDPKDLTLSRHLLSSDINSLLSLDSIDELKRLRDDMRHKAQSFETKVEGIQNELEDLYIRLDLSMVKLRQFLHKHQGIGPSVISALNVELDRCKELKRQNVEKFILNCRRELERYWNTCHVSEEARFRRFKPFFEETYCETLLELHETELAKTKQFYEKCKPILEVFESYMNVWEEFVEMERKANDPARLLTRGRGGGLLQEQKKRKEIEKKLPKLEERLANLVNEWELDEGETFLVYDWPILIYISQQKQELAEEKEALKKAKQDQKEKEKENEMRFGTKSSLKNQSKKRTAAAHGIGTTLMNTPSKKGKFGSNNNITHQSNPWTKTSSSSGSNRTKGNISSSVKKQPPPQKTTALPASCSQKLTVVNNKPLKADHNIMNINSRLPYQPQGQVAVNGVARRLPHPQLKSRYRKSLRGSIVQSVASKKQTNEKPLISKIPQPPVLSNIDRNHSPLVEQNHHLNNTCEDKYNQSHNETVRRSKRIRELSKTQIYLGTPSIMSTTSRPVIAEGGHEQEMLVGGNSILNETYSTFSNEVLSSTNCHDS